MHSRLGLRRSNLVIETPRKQIQERFVRNCLRSLITARIQYNGFTTKTNKNYSNRVLLSNVKQFLLTCDLETNKHSIGKTVKYVNCRYTCFLFLINSVPIFLNSLQQLKFICFRHLKKTCLFFVDLNVF